METTSYISEPFTLPPDNATNLPTETQGWKIETKVHRSTIPEAGRGVFAQTDAAPGDLICEKPIVYMTDENSTLDFPPNAAITFKTKHDLDKFVEHGVNLGFTQDKMLALIADFVGGTNTDECFICNSSHVINHSWTPNAVHELRDGAYCIVACADIKAGDELYCDYRKYAMPDFYLKEFCGANGIRDLATTALEAVAAKEASEAI